MTDIWSQALEEAYTAAPSTAIVLPTIELRHSSFVDDVGNPIAIRMVRDHGDLIEESDTGPDIRGLYFTLEESAPLNAGESVIFQSVMFDFTLPEQSKSQVGGMSISFDNVSKIISGYLDNAVKVRSSMSLIYREYLFDTPEPQLIITNLSIKSVTSTIFKVEGDASFIDLINKKFPNKEYTAEEFPGLAD